MHRSYQPILPTHNKLLQRRWDTADYEGHRKRLTLVRPQIDSRPPHTYLHLHLKLKKLQMEEERLAEIERDNRILLQKMSDIMRPATQGGGGGRPSTQGSRPVTQGGGRTSSGNWDPNAKSLNREARLRDMLRVSRENEDILKRITTAQPRYDHNTWARDWDINRQYMAQISHYPPPPYTARGGGGGGGGGGSETARSRTAASKQSGSPRVIRREKTNNNLNSSSPSSSSSSSSSVAGAEPTKSAPTATTPRDEPTNTA